MGVLFVESERKYGASIVATCNAARSVTSWLARTTVRVLPWPGDAPDLNPQHIKEKVATKQGSSMPELVEAIKHVWVFEISHVLHSTFYL